MTQHRLNTVGRIAVVVLAMALGDVAYLYAAGMASAHAMEPGIAYALIGYACGLIGALIGVLNSKLFRRGSGSAA
jgi:biopolymer transport protein ExbB/TolQ